MDLSNDLISKFVKITNDDKKKNSESTVYGTVVEHNGGMYVKIDGSDLLTPVETTADFKPDERVTVMIKNHSATVTGNITSPATNEGAVTEKVTEAVEDVEGKVITEVEILIADRVSTEQLDAEVARIDTLIAGKATIEDLEAVDAKIENLEVENLGAINAEIKNLKANKAEIVDLKATTAEIEVLDAKVATIDTLVNGNLTSDNILSFNITSQNTTMENAFIKDAMIDSITANKIMSGVIDTNKVRVQSTDGSLLIQGTLIQMKDEDGKVRIQIGKDTGGNFTFILYDKNGTGVLIDEDGIKSSNAIADGLIVDAKVADNANISGSKLDIASVITEVNNDNSTTIKSNKIYLNEQNQSLEVAFNSLKSQVETIQDVTINGDSTAVVEQVQSNTTKIEANKEGISTLVAENAIRKEEIRNLDGEIESVSNTLSNKYSSLEQDVSGFKTTVADTYTTKAEFNNLQVGGRNLYKRTKTMNSSDWNENLHHDFSSTTSDGFTIASKSIAWGGLRQSTVTIKAGKTYTLSVYAKGDGAATINCYSDNFSILKRSFTQGEVVSTTWRRYWFTFLNNESSDAPCHARFENSINGATIQYYAFKLEEGNKATDWTPAPEDVQGEIDDISNNLAINYSTTSAMNSAIDQKANEITSSVSATYATKQSVTDVNNKFSNYSTTSQMNSAIDQKANQITSSVSQTYATKQSVTDVNNKFNSYSTTTQMNSIIQQTASDLTLKFSESGGYNLLQNGHADKGASYWENNGGGINVFDWASGNATGNFFATSLPNGIRYYDWIRLLPNTHYVYQAKVWTDITFNGNSYVPLHYLFSYDGVNNTSDGYTILDYQQDVPNGGKWIQCYIHFVTGPVSIYIKPFIYNDLASTSTFYVTELMLSQSRVVLPWSPHPSEIYSGITQIDKDGIKVYHNNANSYTHMAPDGFFVNHNGTDVVQVTANGLYVQGNITSGSTIQGARISGSTFNSSNDVFQVLEDGTIETSYLSVNGAVSTDKLNVNDIENASYPKVLSEATTVYINPNGGVNSEEFCDGAQFTSISNMLALAPRNLNGYTLTIRMMGDLYENAALTWFHSGQVNFEMQGYTLYGYFYGYGPSMCYRLYGDRNSSSGGIWGHIKPNAGRNLGSYYYAVLFQYCQFAVNYIAVYPSATSGSSSGGIGAHRGATGIVFTARACGDIRYLVRAEYAARVHVNSSEGACNNATFCASTGGIITLNSSSSQAGRTTSGNPYWVGSGGIIASDQLLGMDKIKFNNAAQSGSSSSSGSTTRKVTETIKATSADTYRSTVYNNWKGDGTVRQGDYGYGDCQGCWFFGNNLYTTMNAGTVTKVVIRMNRQSGGVSSLQTLTVKSHNHTSRPSGAPTYTDTIGTCSCAVGSSIDLVITDSATINKLKSCKGLGLSIGSASSPYVVCSGSCSVIITYTTND